ncbi:hypothetical protein REPUB_Repub01dG0072800 [Reevesia pubescens]
MPCSKEALNFALEIGITDVEVEGDSILTVCAIKNSQVDHSITGGIVESIKFQVPNFNKFRISHVKRGGNSVGHVWQSILEMLWIFTLGLKNA